MEILFSTSLLPAIKSDDQLHYHSYQTALQNLKVHIQLFVLNCFSQLLPMEKSTGKPEASHTRCLICNLQSATQLCFLYPTLVYYPEDS